MGRRAAIFLHAQDVDEVKGGKSKTKNEKAKTTSTRAARPAPQKGQVRSSSTPPVDTYQRPCKDEEQV